MREREREREREKERERQTDRDRERQREKEREIFLVVSIYIHKSAQYNNYKELIFMKQVKTMTLTFALQHLSYICL